MKNYTILKLKLSQRIIPNFGTASGALLLLFLNTICSVCNVWVRHTQLGICLYQFLFFNDAPKEVQKLGTIRFLL